MTTRATPGGLTVRVRPARDHYICCRHSTPGATSGREPTGVQHLRLLGSPLTACGARASEWPLFFDVPVDVRNPDLCRDCGRAVGLRP